MFGPKNIDSQECAYSQYHSDSYITCDIGAPWEEWNQAYQIIK